MTDILLAIQCFATLAMVGVIWFVQVVHYPLFAKVGRQEFGVYEELHQRQTTFVVAPLMLVELATASLFLWDHPASSGWLPLVGFLLVCSIWASTFFVQVPCHRRLAGQFDASTHRLLVNSNWFRTFAWTARGVILCSLFV